MTLDDLRRQISDLRVAAAERPFRVRNIPEQAIALGESLLVERERIAAALALIAAWPPMQHIFLCGTRDTPPRGCIPLCGGDAEEERRAVLIRTLTGGTDGR